MNMQAVSQLENDFPEEIEEWLEYGTTKCVAFNKKGTLLAAGCHGGNVVVWDFETRGVARELKGHTGEVTCVKWSRNGRLILSSSLDKSIRCWGVEESSLKHVVELESPVMSARFHPQDNNIALVCPLNSVPIIMSLSTGEKCELNGDGIGDAENPLAVTYSAAFNKDGSQIFVGGSRGALAVFDTNTKETLAVVRVVGGAVVKGISFSSCGNFFLVNCSDRVIRTFSAKSPLECVRAEEQNEEQKGQSKPLPVMPVLAEFQNVVDRMQWRSACFNGNGDYIVGAAALRSEHNIYLWDRLNKRLVKTLEGPKEGLVDVAWHPTRTMMVSVSTEGKIYIWGKTYTENWSAFAPDFKELEENEEYIEREDEFDINEEEVGDCKKHVASDNIEIDIMEYTKPSAHSDDEDDLHYLAVERRTGRCNMSGDITGPVNGMTVGNGAPAVASNDVMCEGAALATPAENVTSDRKKLRVA